MDSNFRSLPLGSRSGPLSWTASYAVLLLLPVHHRKTAVELSGELHAFFDVD